MKRIVTHIASTVVFAIILSINISQAQAQAPNTYQSDRAQARDASRFAAPSASVFTITPMAAGPNLQVLGGGTLGRLTKWSGFTSANSFIGDTTIFEDKFGMVGIGTDSPTSRLTVAGTIHSLSGGFKFPDATIQTTAFDPNQVVRSLNGLRGDLTLAAGPNITITPSGGDRLTIAAPNVLTSVSHNATLVGDGTAASPLSIADGGVGTAQLANSAVTQGKIASGQVVKGLNGLTDQVALAAGSNITITPSGNTLTIASTASNPALSAFQAHLGISIPTDGSLFTGEIQIPANKRLVIEYITVTLGTAGGSLVECTVITHIGNGGDVRHNIRLVKDPDHVIFAADGPVRIYADGSLKLEIYSSDGSLGTAGNFTVSGYLVDLP